MTWDEDGWPVMGDAGEPVARHRKPAAPPQPPAAPATDDTFPGGRFGPQWQWTANRRPRPGPDGVDRDRTAGWTVEYGGRGCA